ncbi:MAG: hypothetical protein HZA31_00150 [Opitutae bacterium]|nr:hypothetical protein [Opitutae bacterium]
MNKSSSQAFVNQVLIYTLVMICFSGSLGLGAVWLRHQITVTAQLNRQRELRIAELQRRLDDVKVARATEESSEALLQRNAAWQLGLMAPKDLQVRWVTENVAARLAAKSSREAFAEGRIVLDFKPGSVALR